MNTRNNSQLLISVSSIVPRLQFLYGRRRLFDDRCLVNVLINRYIYDRPYKYPYGFLCFILRYFYNQLVVYVMRLPVYVTAVSLSQQIVRSGLCQRRNREECRSQTLLVAGFLDISSALLDYVDWYEYNRWICKISTFALVVSTGTGEITKFGTHIHIWYIMYHKYIHQTWYRLNMLISIQQFSTNTPIPSELSGRTFLCDYRSGVFQWYCLNSRLGDA